MWQEREEAEPKEGERHPFSLCWALAKCDWNLGSELGSGTADWHMEPQAVSDDFRGLERSELMHLKKLPFIVA